MEFELKPDVGKPIPNQTCKDWSNRFQKGNKVLNIDWAFFGKDSIEKMLTEKPGEIAGFMIHPCINDKGEPELILSTVDKNGGMIMSYDNAGLCPPFCDPPPPPDEG